MVSIGGSGFFGKSEAESKEEMRSEYLRNVGTPMSMEIPEWATMMTEEFMKSMFGSEYYDQIAGDKEAKKEADEARKAAEVFNDNYEKDLLKYRQTKNIKYKRDADYNVRRRDQKLEIVKAYELRLGERQGYGDTPYETAVEQSYGETRGAREDILGYLESQQNLIPEATAAAAGEYSDLMSTMIDKSLGGESVIPQIGLPDTGFAGLLDRLTSPVSIGLQGHGGMSFVPKGAAEALREVFAGRQGALDQLQGWGQSREEADLRPAYSQYEHGLAPMQYALDMAEQTPEAGSLLQQLAGLRGMWAPVGETAMQLGGQVPIISESELTTGSSSAESEAFGSGGSGSIST